MIYNDEKSEWVFASGKRIYAHTDVLGIGGDPGELDIAYGADGAIGHEELTKYERIELGSMMVNRWIAYLEAVSK